MLTGDITDNTPSGNGTPVSNTIPAARVDREKPSVRVDGDLYRQRGAIIGAPDYTIDLDASDGETGAGADPRRARSGVRKVEVSVNGAQVYASGDVPCPNNNCRVTRSPLIDFEPIIPELGGAYNIEIRATDWADNVSDPIRFTVYGEAGREHQEDPEDVDSPDPATAPDTRACVPNAVPSVDYCGAR